MSHINLIITTNPKPVIDTQQRERKPGVTLKLSSHTGREQEKNYKNNQKTVNKMPINTYLSVVTLDINVQNA